MVHLKLSTEQFKSLISDIVNEINDVQHGSYTLTFNDPTTDRERCEAIISQNWGGVFYLTYMDALKALTTLYDISIWFEAGKDGAPQAVLINE